MWQKKSKKHRKKLSMWFRNFSISDWAVVFILLLAVGAIIYHVYETRRTIPYLEIDSPLPLIDENGNNFHQEPVYTVDSPITIEVKGIRHRDSSPTIARKLVCDNTSKTLEPFLSSDTITRRGVIDTQITFSIRQLLPESSPIPRPDTNCEIQYESVDDYSLPLGGTRPLESNYYTETFHLIGD